MILVPALQPIVYGSTAEVLAYEVLARWRVNDKIMGPSDVGIEPSWRAVDAKMLSTIHDLSGTIASIAPRLFVNVSKGTVSDSKYLAPWLENLMEILDDASFAVVVEITEGVDDDCLQDAWPRLKRLGVKMALDDFGHDRSSRSRLVRYDWDYCKFESGLVGGRATQDAIRYCRNSGILPIVERVERQHDSEQFTAMGLHWQQGFLHGRPAPIDCLKASEKLSWSGLNLAGAPGPHSGQVTG
ncbi:EAL domain-containing protein [Castellaniella sp.]|uniref:EAL domain-containing protein n=1 Tax=Castellaniella sp. TaxID=1955812 RepID=UPI002AFE3092|nr:EAL domain-containing protein [Castellaniella sp.]